MALIPHWSVNMPPKDKHFYPQLGQRIAQQCKALNLTQTQLAEMLGISQQTMAHYEGGHLRISVELLTILAQELTTSIEALLGRQTAAKNKKRGPASTLQRQIELISQLPRAKQKFVMEMLDTVIKQQQSA